VVAELGGDTVKEQLRLIEPVPIEDDLCTGLAIIEDIGVGARFVLYAEQTCYENNSIIHVVKRKIILPVEAIGPGVEMTVAFLAKRMARGLLRLRE
jgi:hypothetical protein